MEREEEIYFKKYKKKKKNPDYKPRTYTKDMKLTEKKVLIELFQNGQIVEVVDDCGRFRRKAIVVKDYIKFIRVNIIEGDTYYSECFQRNEVRKI